MMRIQMMRFLISGSITALSNFSTFYVSYDFFYLHYALAVVIASPVAFFVSFTLQKFWTFKDTNLDDVASQMMKYAVSGAVQIGINVLAIYLLVTSGVNPIVAEVISLAIIATGSFFVYKFLIFRSPLPTPKP